MERKKWTLLLVKKEQRFKNEAEVMKQKNMKRLMKGAVILSLATLSAKILSALYKIPLQNWTGDTGFYVYQQAYPLYGMAAALALNGLPLFVSSCIAEESSERGQAAVFKRLFYILLIPFTLLGMLLYIYARPLAGVMGDPQLSPLIQSIALIYPLTAVIGSLRGFFQGQMNMVPTAVSQVTEQLVRVSLIILAAFQFTQSGQSVYQMGRHAYQGTFIAAAVSSLILLFYALAYRKEQGRLIKKDFKGQLPSPKKLYQRFLHEGLLLSAFASLFILLQLIDSFTILNQLQEAGLSLAQSMVQKGVYDRAQPIAQLGLVVSSGLTATMLPSLSQPRLQKRPDHLKLEARSIIRLVVVFSGAASVGLMALMPQLNRFLFASEDQNDVLAIYMLAVFLMSILLAFQNILHLQKKHPVIFRGLGFTLLTKLVLNKLCIPHFQTMGASVATVVSLAAVVSYFAHHLRGILFQRNQAAFLKGYLSSLLVLALFVRILLNLLDGWWGEGRGVTLAAILLAVAGGAAVFLRMIQVTKVLSIREWMMLPMGEHLLRGKKNGKN